MKPMADLVELDLGAAQTSMDLHLLLSERLGFPDFYGRNWDAFWDCITDPELSSMPRVLRLRGWADLDRRLPGDARLLRESLDDLPSERPGVTIEWI